MAGAPAAAHRQVPAHGPLQRTGIGEALGEGRTADDLLQGALQVHAPALHHRVHHADADVGAAVLQGEDPEVPGPDLVDEVQLDLVGGAGDPLVVAAQGDDPVPGLVGVEAGAAGDDGVEAVAAEDDAGRQGLLGAGVAVAVSSPPGAVAAHAGDAAAVVADQVPDGEPLAHLDAALPGLADQEVVEDAAADHVAAQRQVAAGEGIVVAAVAQVDAEADVLGAGHEDTVDLAALQGRGAFEESQLVEDGEGLPGQRVAADLVAREGVAVDDDRGQALAGGVHGRGGPRGAGADDQQVAVSLHGGRKIRAPAGSGQRAPCPGRGLP